MFPQAEDPKGEPEKWTEDEMKRWLNAVSKIVTIRALYECETDFSIREISWQAPRRRERSCLHGSRLICGRRELDVSLRGTGFCSSIPLQRL